MREAQGMSGMMYMAIIILAMFVGLITFAFAYTNAFRSKNRIIDILETYVNEEEAIQAVEKYLNANYYNTNSNCSASSTWTNNQKTFCLNKGVIIVANKTDASHINVDTIYYSIKVPLYTNQSFLNKIFAKTNLYISGETKTIYRESK